MWSLAFLRGRAAKVLRNWQTESCLAQDRDRGGAGDDAVSAMAQARALIGPRDHAPDAASRSDRRCSLRLAEVVPLRQHLDFRAHPAQSSS